MIYTVTFNPSLDYVAAVENFKEGIINRTVREAVFPGGKGFNVSRVLNHLGQDNVALGFIADFTGDMIEQRMKAYGCRCRFIPVEKGMSRINLKLSLSKETEINGKGPEIGEKEIKKFYEILDGLQPGDYLVLAGSIPGCLSADTYREIMQRYQNKGIRFVVDAEGELLANVLPFHPFLIKPNHLEISGIFHKKIETKEELIFYGKKLQEMGAANVLISRAGEGAILIAEDGRIMESPAPKGQVVNSVGAGDSMVAGFLAGYLENGDYANAFYTGVAAGSATAFSEDLADKDYIMKIRETIL